MLCRRNPPSATDEARIWIMMCSQVPSPQEDCFVNVYDDRMDLSSLANFMRKLDLPSNVCAAILLCFMEIFRPVSFLVVCFDPTLVLKLAICNKPLSSQGRSILVDSLSLFFTEIIFHCDYLIKHKHKMLAWHRWWHHLAVFSVCMHFMTS